MTEVIDLTVIRRTIRNTEFKSDLHYGLFRFNFKIGGCHRVRYEIV